MLKLKPPWVTGRRTTTIPVGSWRHHSCLCRWYIGQQIICYNGIYIQGVFCCCWVICTMARPKKDLVRLANKECMHMFCCKVLVQTNGWSWPYRPLLFKIHRIVFRTFQPVLGPGSRRDSPVCDIMRTISVTLWFQVWSNGRTSFMLIHGINYWRSRRISATIICFKLALLSSMIALDLVQFYNRGNGYTSVSFIFHVDAYWEVLLFIYRMSIPLWLRHICGWLQESFGRSPSPLWWSYSNPNTSCLRRNG